MNKILRVFTDDWVRKLIAVLFAVVLWLDVQGRIAIEREIKLNVTTLSALGLGENDFSLRIKAPEGWKLTSPTSGESVSIWLRGSSNELQDFTARQCAASIDVHFEADNTQHRIDYSLSPSDLNWLRPSDAQYLLNSVNRAQPLQKLTFERVTESVHVLDAHDISIIGAPAATHVADLANAQFTNHSQVTLSGPKFAMDRLQADLASANDAQSSGLLSPLHIAPKTRQDIRGRLHLSEQWRDAGVRMAPPQIDLNLPVRLAQTAKFVWLPTAAELQVLKPNDSDGEWQVLPWEPTQWIAELPEVSTTEITIDAAWVKEHVIFILPLTSLSGNSLDRSSISVQAILTGFSNEEDLLFFQRNMVVRPLQPEDALVTVARLKQ